MASPQEESCRTCGRVLAPGARFCSFCGSPASPATCSSCGAPLAPQARFCSACGAPVSGGAPRTPVTERRITSVLFGDLVGFTTLSEHRDAEDTRALLSRYFAECRTIIERYGGTVEKFVGDAVMAVWGVPVAHEDDAERAVRAGLELTHAVDALGEQVGAPGLRMRVGVVTGEVAATLGVRGEGMVTGDAVNTASRVQSVAEPGQVWVDDTTRVLTAPVIAFEDRGAHLLKGKAAPVHLYSARAVQAEVGGGEGGVGLEAPLTGREPELRLLKELFHATEESRRPRLVVLDGEPGIGKSRLAWAFEKYVEGLPSTIPWLRGRCLAYGDCAACWALSDAIRAHLGVVRGASPEAISERLDVGLAELVTDTDEREWLRPRLAALIGGEASPGQEAAFPREDLFAAWTTFLERIAGDGPLVLVIADAQHSDDSLLDFIDHLLGSARSAIFVLVLARPELMARRPELGGRRGSVLRLNSLDDATMGELLDGLVVGLTDSSRATLVGRADGIPLFAMELVRALVDRGAIARQDGHYVATASLERDLEDIGAPASLQALAAARLDALDPEERRVATDASVLGAALTRDGLAALANSVEAPVVADLDRVLASLQRKEILTVHRDRTAAERGGYRFVQAVMRQVAYATQSRRDRKARHLAAAEYLSQLDGSGEELTVVIAQHLLEAVDSSAPGDADVEALTTRARDLLGRAARRALGLGTTAEAQRLFESALARSDDPPEQARLRVSAAEAASSAGHYLAALEHAQEATRLYDATGHPVEAGYAASIHAMVLLALRDNAGAMAVARPRLEALDETAGAERTLFRLASVLSAAAQSRGEADGESFGLERRLLLAEAVGDPELLAYVHHSMGTHYSSIGAAATALVLYRSAASLARKHGLNTRLALSLNDMAAVECSRDLGASIASSREAIDTGRRAGNRTAIDFATVNHLLALWTAGDLDELRRLLPEAQEDSIAPGTRWPRAAVAARLAEALGSPLPEPDGSEVTDSEQDLAWLGDVQIREARAAGDIVGAAEIAERTFGHLMAAKVLEDDFMHLWPPLVTVALEAGDLHRAEQFLVPVTERPTGLIPPIVRVHLQRFRGLLGAAKGDDPAQVEADLRAGVAGLSDFGAVGLAAQAEEELARWLLDTGRAAEAEPLLEHVRSVYERLGAVGWLKAMPDVVGADADSARSRVPAANFE